MGFEDIFGGTSRSRREQQNSQSSSQSESGWSSPRYRQFIRDISGTVGGPLTLGDMLQLAPRTSSLFGGDASGMLAGQNRPGGGINLGFGTPAGIGTSAVPAGCTPPANTTPTGPRTYTQADILPAWDDDPEKRMDIPRLFRQAGLDPNHFTLPDFQNAVSRAGEFGFSSRSRGNFSRALALLQGA